MYADVNHLFAASEAVITEAIGILQMEYENGFRLLYNVQISCMETNICMRSICRAGESRSEAQGNS